MLADFCLCRNDYFVQLSYIFFLLIYFSFGNQKPSVGGTAEKIVSAFQTLLGDEDAEMSKCKSAVHRIRKLEKDVDVACANGMKFTSRVGN